MTMPTDPYFANKKTESKNQGVKIDPRRAALYEKLNSTRPASEIILNEEEVQLYLNISPRKLVNLREQRLIGYTQPVPRGMIHYTFQDLLDYYESGRKPTISNTRRF